MGCHWHMFAESLMHSPPLSPSPPLTQRQVIQIWAFWNAEWYPPHQVIVLIKILQLFARQTECRVQKTENPAWNNSTCNIYWEAKPKIVFRILDTNVTWMLSIFSKSNNNSDWMISKGIIHIPHLTIPPAVAMQDYASRLTDWQHIIVVSNGVSFCSQWTLWPNQNYQRKKKIEKKTQNPATTDG